MTDEVLAACTVGGLLPPRTCPVEARWAGLSLLLIEAPDLTFTVAPYI